MADDLDLEALLDSTFSVASISTAWWARAYAQWPDSQVITYLEAVKEAIETTGRIPILSQVVRNINHLGRNESLQDWADIAGDKPVKTWLRQHVGIKP